MDSIKFLAIVVDEIGNDGSVLLQYHLEQVHLLIWLMVQIPQALHPLRYGHH